MDYVALKYDVYTIIKEFGSSGTMSFSTRTTYDVATDNWITETTDYVVDLVTVNHREYDGADGPKEGEKMFLISAYGLPKVINTADNNTAISISFAGKGFEVRNMEAIDPNGLALLYKAIVRGS